ncbi:MAG: hypothetical protein JWM95_3312 [Gemmatimonadetes bacterium]|nr:hypothetical protein [Gemmatimonadota bacterium]
MRRALALAVFAAACGRSKAPPADTAAATAANTATAAPSVGPTCARTGHWTECQIRIRLDQSGLAPARAEKGVGDLPKIEGTPITLMIGNAGLALYIYGDTLSRHRAGALLDTVKFIPQTKPVGMRGEVTVIQNDNLLALLFSKNDHQRERVADAITAGPSQP